MNQYRAAVKFWQVSVASILNPNSTLHLASYSTITKLLPLFFNVCEGLSHGSLSIYALPTPARLGISRDSRFSRLGTETPRLSVQVSTRNRNRYRNSVLRSLGIGLGTETLTFQVSESEPESKVRHCKSQNRNRNRN